MTYTDENGMTAFLQAEIVANGISTTIASTKQFTEYLNDIYTFSYAKGVLLEIPQDLAWCRG